MPEGVTAAVTLAWEMLSSLMKGYSGRNKDFFNTHIEPLQQRLTEIHKDYVAGFQEVRDHLQNSAKPSPDIIEFLRQRRREYESERSLSAAIVSELEGARKLGMSDEVWDAVLGYIRAIELYFSAATEPAAISWYTDFLWIVQAQIRAGRDNVWSTPAIAGNARLDLLGTIDSVLDHGLPRAFRRVAEAYAVLRTRLL